MNRREARTAYKHDATPSTLNQMLKGIFSLPAPSTPRGSSLEIFGLGTVEGETKVYYNQVEEASREDALVITGELAAGIITILKNNARLRDSSLNCHGAVAYLLGLQRSPHGSHMYELVAAYDNAHSTLTDSLPDPTPEEPIITHLCRGQPRQGRKLECIHSLLLLGTIGEQFIAFEKNGHHKAQFTTLQQRAETYRSLYALFTPFNQVRDAVRSSQTP